MYTKQSKKLLPLYILEILKKYTDEKHTLTQKEIAVILKNDYEMLVERKTIMRALKDIIQFYEDTDYRIGYSVEERMVPVKDVSSNEFKINADTGERIMEKQEAYTDFYLDRPITDSELRLLIDALLFSMHISYNHRKDLLNKLCMLSNKYFKTRETHIACISDSKNYNQSIFNNIEVIDEAISKKRKVSFKYTEYGTDKKLHIKRDTNEKERVYIINPYQMVASEGKYYLICNFDKYDDISNYRIDRIKSIEIVDEPVKPFERLKCSNGRRLDLETYMKEHIYMYSSESVNVRFRINKPMISDVIDIFGSDVRFTDENDLCVTVCATVNKEAIVQFAKSYGPDVEILEPQGVREKVKEELEKALMAYRR